MLKTQSNKWAILSITRLNFLGLFHFLPCDIDIIRLHGRADANIPEKS